MICNFKGRDYKHSLEMQKILRNQIGSIEVFLLLFNGGEPRYVNNCQNNNTLLVFSVSIYKRVQT